MRVNRAQRQAANTVIGVCLLAGRQPETPAPRSRTGQQACDGTRASHACPRTRAVQHSDTVADSIHDGQGIYRSSRSSSISQCCALGAFSAHVRHSLQVRLQRYSVASVYRCGVNRAQGQAANTVIAATPPQQRLFGGRPHQGLASGSKHVAEPERRTRSV
jgi:hypothetical protein